MCIAIAEKGEQILPFSLEHFEMNTKEEITPEGFLKLNLMEAQEDLDELWITLKTMGYNNGLELTKVKSKALAKFQISPSKEPIEGAH